MHCKISYFMFVRALRCTWTRELLSRRCAVLSDLMVNEHDIVASCVCVVYFC